MLPSGVARIDGGELAGDVQVSAIAFDRLVEPLECDEQRTHPVENDRQKSLRLDVARVAGCELLEDRDRLAKARKRLLELLHSDQRVGDPAVAESEVVLPVGIAGIGRRKPLADGKTF